MTVVTNNEEAVIEQARKILKRRVNRGRLLSSPTVVRDWLQMELSSLEHEVFYVVFLDAQHRVLGKEGMFRGTVNGAAVYPREIVKRCLHYNASAIICAHPHPSGVCEPSSADRAITVRIRDALALVDIQLLDHFVITNGDCYSFAENGN